VVRSWLGPQQVEKQEQASIASAIEGANLRKINLSPYSMLIAKLLQANYFDWPVFLEYFNYQGSGAAPYIGRRFPG